MFVTAGRSPGVVEDIDPLLTPDLLLLRAEMGHTDGLAIVDRNYPAHSAGRLVPDVQAELDAAEGRSMWFGGIARPEFYAAARGAYAVVLTTENLPHACVLLSKVVM